MDLKPGEILCDECKGTGYNLTIPKQEYNHEYYKKHYPCKKCHGEGKLDWIENVVGKRLSFIITKQKLNPKTRQIENRYYYDGTELR